MTKQDTARRVGEALELVQMSDYATRRPAQLSGGPQQRMALARALVLGPTVLLLDEPLGALDAQLPKHLQVELKSIQQELGITFVYVTHDQEEALTMSDRLAVMHDGRVEQVGAPRAVNTAPDSAYVAGFLGSANVLDVEVSVDVNGDGDVACRLGTLPLRASGPTGRPCWSPSPTRASRSRHPSSWGARCEPPSHQKQLVCCRVRPIRHPTRPT